MQAVDVNALTAQVLWAAFALSVAFGAIAQRTHFCTMGAIADIFSMGDWTRMRMWVLAIGVAIIGFNTMVWLGWVDASKTFYVDARGVWLSAVVGGFLFGFGMVLASGCGSKTLVRIGGGSLKSLVVFLVLGLSAWATLRGVTGVLRVGTIDRIAVTLPTSQDLPSVLSHLLGMQKAGMALLLGLLAGGACIAFAVSRPEGRQREVLFAGIGIGLIVVLAWVVSGRLGYLAENPDTLEETFLATNSHRMEALSFVSPAAYTLDWLVMFSDASQKLSIGIVSALGVASGSAVVALATRSFRWEGFRNAADTANHLVGAVLMGVGGVTALGCTIGQGLSGVSTLSITSAIAFAGIVCGAVASLKLQVWRLERQA